jgi:hypothetical protein
LSTNYQKQSDTVTKIKYGSGTASGYLALDTLCMDATPDTCVKDFKMLSVVQTSGLDGMQADGIVGLAPSI